MRDGGSHTWYGRHQDELDALLKELRNVAATGRDAHLALFSIPDVRCVASSGDPIPNECGFEAQRRKKSKIQWLHRPQALKIHDSDGREIDDLILCADHLAGLGERVDAALRPKIAAAIGPVVRMLRDDFQFINESLKLLMNLAVAYRTAGMLPFSLDELVALIEAFPGYSGHFVARVSQSSDSLQAVSRFTSANAAANYPEFALLLESSPLTLSDATYRQLTERGAEAVELEAVIAAPSRQVKRELRGTSLLWTLAYDTDEPFLLLSICRPVFEFDLTQYVEGIVADVARKMLSVSRNSRFVRVAIPEWLASESRCELSAIPEVNSAVRSFLEEGAKRYSGLRTIVQTHIEALSEVYSLTLPSSLVSSIFREFAALEEDLFHIPRYRDHMLHELVVFLLGLKVLAGMPASDTTDRFRRAYGDSVEWTQEMIEASWFMTALLHDISYPAAKAEPWFDSVLERLNLQVVAAASPIPMRTAADVADPLKRRVGEIADWTSLIMSGDLGLSSKLNADLLSNLVATLDHGVLSAVILMEHSASDLPDAILKAVSTAIAAHDSYLLDPDARQVIGRCTDGNRFVISDELESGDRPQTAPTFDRHPLAALLVYCDTIHEWCRNGLGELVSGEEATGIDVSGTEIRADIKVGRMTPARKNHMKNEKQSAMDRISTPNMRFSIAIDWGSFPQH